MSSTVDEATASLQTLNLDSTTKLKLKSSDNHIFSVEKSIAKQSTMLKNIIEDVTNDSSFVIPIPNVTGYILELVIDFCERNSNADDGEKEKELKEFEAELVEFDKLTMFHLIMAANYLDIRPLLDLGCRTVADLIKDMYVEEVRDYLGVENDFTAEEEEAVRNEYLWAFE